MSELRVLLVEDDALIGLLQKQIVERLGYVVIGPSRSKDEGLVSLAENPNLALLDIQLGRDTSYAIADELERRSIPFAFVSAYGGFDILERFASRTVLAKPFSNEALARLLQDLCPRN